MLPLTKFETKTRGRWGRQAECKTCQKYHWVVRRHLIKENPKSDANGICYHCQQPTERLCLDHDHDTDEFRGWACYSCNNGPLARRAVSKARNYIL